MHPYEEPHHFNRIRKTYDKENRLIKVEDGTGACVRYEYDLRNNRTLECSKKDDKTERIIRYHYDRNGRLTEKRETIEQGIPGRTRRYAVTAFAYDANGNVTRICLPEGGVLQIVYDEADRPVCRLEEDTKNGIRRSLVYRYAKSCPFPEETVWEPEEAAKKRNRILAEDLSRPGEAWNGQALQQALFPECPSVIRVYSGKKAAAIYRAYEQAYADLGSYEPGRGKQIEAGEEGSDYREWSFRYDFRGNLLEECDAEGNRRGYCYDRDGRLVKRIEPEAYHKDGIKGSGTSFTYDTKGRITSRTNGAGETEARWSYDPLGRIAEETDGEGNRTRYQYHHPGGKPIRITHADGTIKWQASYDLWGHPQCTTDGNGNKTRYETDGWGRITGITKADGTTETYAYDYAGNIIRAVDALGQETGFTYTSRNQTSSITKADGTTEYYTYDLEGRCSGRLAANGSLVQTVYNLDGNPVRITGSSIKAREQEAWLQQIPEERSTWQLLFPEEYKEIVPKERRLYAYAPDGRLMRASEGGADYQYTYDRNGRLIQKTAWGKNAVSFTYDRNGNLRTLSTPGGTSIYAYDAAERIKSVSGENGVSAEYRYNRNGMQTEVRFGNGLSTICQYDAQNRLDRAQSRIFGTGDHPREPLPV